MLMAEQIGLAETALKVKIYGTDIDLHALAQARAAVYPEAALARVPEELRDRYFQPEPHGRGLTVLPALRRVVVFGRHDLICDAPISRVDLLCCRNTLMYLNAETQASVVPRLRFALVDGGFLFLGRAEMLVHGAAGLFNTVSLPHRVFTAAPGRAHTVAVYPLAPAPPFVPAVPVGSPDVPGTRWAEIRDSAFQTAVVAQLVVDPNGLLLAANEGARTLFGIGTGDVGVPFRDLRVSFDPVELRAPIEAAIAAQSTQDLGIVRHRRPDGGEMELHVSVLPLLSADGATLGASVAFTDVSPITAMREEFRRTAQELETAHEELQSTNEELETTNEELQSTNEELETTNEELRSTNEELETTNEELRSANDAVGRMNATLMDINKTMDRREAFHHSVMSGVPSALAVVDARLLVEAWNRAAAQLWGLAEADVQGRPFFGLDIGLPTERLQEPVRACLSGTAQRQEVAVEAVDRRGRRFTCRVTIVPVLAGRDGVAVMLVMAEDAG
jgi:two-component system CheB/CheR fusion protein